MRARIRGTECWPSGQNGGEESGGTLACACVLRVLGLARLGRPRRRLDRARPRGWGPQPRLGPSGEAPAAAGVAPGTPGGSSKWAARGGCCRCCCCCRYWRRAGGSPGRCRPGPSLPAATRGTRRAAASRPHGRGGSRRRRGSSGAPSWRRCRRSRNLRSCCSAAGPNRRSRTCRCGRRLYVAGTEKARRVGGARTSPGGSKRAGGRPAARKEQGSITERPQEQAAAEVASALTKVGEAGAEDDAEVV